MIGGLLVGSSLPVNAILVPGAEAAPGVADSRVTGQTLRTSADAVAGLSTRDGFDALSARQVLSLKYSGEDYYTYGYTSGDVNWPFPYAVPTTDGFGPRDGALHKGVDFAPPAGTPIYAIANGTVLSSGFDESGYGNHVVIQHNLAGVDIRTNYAHMILDSGPVSRGDQISAGDFLGLVGDTGIAFGAHLHFEVYVNNVPVDPLPWLRANAVEPD